jgi:hypothetical protein
MTIRPWSLWFIPAAALALALTPGCEEPRYVGDAKPQAKAPEKDNFIVGKRTQDIRDATPELQKGAKEATTKITAKDPITLPGNAYVTSVGRISMGNIEHTVDLWRAENDRYPKDYQEFMDEIIKKNNIALPKLPYYQEYGYNAKEHKLIILEYPDRKNQPMR